MLLITRASQSKFMTSVIWTHMGLILTDLNISIDDIVVNGIFVHRLGNHGYVRQLDEGRIKHGSVQIHLSAETIFTNPLMWLPFVARRFVLFHLVAELYCYWIETNRLDFNRSHAESYAEDWVRKNV